MFLTGFILCFKKTFFAPHCLFIKIFHSQQIQSILVSPCCNNSCRNQQELDQDDFYLFDRKKFSVLSIYLLPAYEKNHDYLTHSQYYTCLLKKYSCLQHMSQNRHLQTCKTSDLPFWLTFLVSSVHHQQTTLGFLHSSFQFFLNYNNVL